MQFVQKVTNQIELFGHMTSRDLDVYILVILRQQLDDHSPSSLETSFSAHLSSFLKVNTFIKIDSKIFQRKNHGKLQCEEK